MSNDGGPAFPCEYDVSAKLPDNPKPGTLYPLNEHVVARGMSLRDWFAGQAIASPSVPKSSLTDMAAFAYLIADAMLAEREKGK